MHIVAAFGQAHIDQEQGDSGVGCRAAIPILCGLDQRFGKGYEHRRGWLEDRLRVLASPKSQQENDDIWPLDDKLFTDRISVPRNDR